MPYIKVQDTNIYYELQGKEGSPVLVFLHGLGSSGHDWIHQVAYFKTDYQILTIDMRGHGQSDKPKTAYSMPRFAADVIAVLDSLKIQKAHFIGLSMGGMITFQIAADFPERVLSITIANSGPSVVINNLKDRMSVWLRFAVVRLFGMRKMGEIIAPRLFVDPSHETERQMFIDQYGANDPTAYLNAVRAIAGWTVEDKIGTMQVPALIIAADQDYTPISAKEAYCAKMPQAQLKIMENAHHAAPVERPEAFNAIVHEFLQRVG